MSKGKYSKSNRENERRSVEKIFRNIPPGIVIPYEVDGKILKLRIIREINGKLPEIGKEIYYTVPGSADIPYHPEKIRSGFPAILVDEEFDVSMVEQEAGGMIAAMGLGGLSSARHQKFVDLLSQASIVLICLPNTEEGNEALLWWSKRLPNSKRWRVPSQYINVNDMKIKGADIRSWLQSGIEEGLIGSEGAF
jgi:hypothetical protein